MLRGLTPSPGDGRNDADRIAILRWRIFLLQIANVFVVEIHVDEAADFSVIRVQMLVQFAEF